MLQFLGPQRVGHDLVTEKQQKCRKGVMRMTLVSFADFFHLKYYSGFVTDKEKMAENQPLKACVFEGINQ